MKSRSRTLMRVGRVRGSWCQNQNAEDIEERSGSMEQETGPGRMRVSGTQMEGQALGRRGDVLSFETEGKEERGLVVRGKLTRCLVSGKQEVLPDFC